MRYHAHPYSRTAFRNHLAFHWLHCTKSCLRAVGRGYIARIFISGLLAMLSGLAMAADGPDKGPLLPTLVTARVQEINGMKILFAISEPPTLTGEMFFFLPVRPAECPMGLRHQLLLPAAVAAELRSQSASRRHDQELIRSGISPNAISTAYTYPTVTESELLSPPLRLLK